MCGSLLPKANGGGERRDYAHSKRAIQRILFALCSRWHDDRVTLVFQLFASHAGRQEKSGRKFLPARARVNLQKSLSPVSSVILKPVVYEVKVSYLRCESQLLAMQKSVTYDAKVSYLRYKSQLLAMQKTVTYDAKVCYLRCKRQLRKWFKYGLKAQKLLEAARPERAEAPSPGHRPGYNSS